MVMSFPVYLFTIYLHWNAELKGAGRAISSPLFRFGVSVKSRALPL